jgi:uncharacterized protein with FMN-binding domain
MRRAIAAIVLTAVVVVLLASYRTHPPRTADAARRADVRAARTPPAAHRRRDPHVHSATGIAIATEFQVVQVRATLTRGRLTGVETVALGSSDPHSQALEARAEPILRAEALKAGSARIDVVSGATYTSRSYIRSLQSAIDAARAGKARAGT